MKTKKYLIVAAILGGVLFMAQSKDEAKIEKARITKQMIASKIEKARVTKQMIAAKIEKARVTRQMIA
ncbi:hypothetical protein [Aestuariivivens sediminicola]|uniref:hypothetical protein n=1 Tax=Aestuariivivens sediminicola TaxID=2913560 RepID=UPI001F569038|nr:hypothetical protein [Aestuariivivens sediminicola]